MCFERPLSNRLSAWIAGGREGKEPAKWLFPRHFSRGVEAFGQERLTPETVGDSFDGFGLPVVEGPLDTMGLSELGIHSVALLSNQASDGQTERIAALAHEFTDGVVTLLYDLDDAGQKGMEQDIEKFSRRCKVQQGWWVAGSRNRHWTFSDKVNVIIVENRLPVVFVRPDEY